MKLVVQYFCNLLIKKKQLTSYPLSTPIRLLAQRPHRTLLLLKNEILKQLTDLFDLSFSLSPPFVLKTAKVVPVLKKDCKLDYSKYHPISLLSNIEKFMYKRLYTFLNKKNVIYNLQFGFRQQYSTSHGLINITENIRKALDDGNIGCGVFVDLQKLLILLTTRYCQQN